MLQCAWLTRVSDGCPVDLSVTSKICNLESKKFTDRHCQQYFSCQDGTHSFHTIHTSPVCTCEMSKPTMTETWHSEMLEVPPPFSVDEGVFPPQKKHPAHRTHHSVISCPCHQSNLQELRNPISWSTRVLGGEVVEVVKNCKDLAARYPLQTSFIQHSNWII